MSEGYRELKWPCALCFLFNGNFDFLNKVAAICRFDCNGSFSFLFALILLPETMATTFGLLDENCKVLFVAFVGRIVVAILNDFPTFIVYAFFLRRRDLTGTFFATTVMLAVAV